MKHCFLGLSSGTKHGFCCAVSNRTDQTLVDDMEIQTKIREVSCRIYDFWFKGLDARLVCYFNFDTTLRGCLIVCDPKLNLWHCCDCRVFLILFVFWFIRARPKQSINWLFDCKIECSAWLRAAEALLIEAKKNIEKYPSVKNTCGQANWVDPYFLMAWFIWNVLVQFFLQVMGQQYWETGPKLPTTVPM